MQLRPLFSFLGSSLRHRSRPFRALTALAAGGSLLGAAVPPAGNVLVTVTGLRSTDGQVLACMTSDSSRFPSCDEDSEAYSLEVPASESMQLDFGRVAPGRYAIALLHDENGNGRVDRVLAMLPREGFGFSRDAPLRLGPPSFEDAAITVGEAPVRATIRMRYML